MEVQWLGLYASTVGGLGLVLDQGTKIPNAEGHSQRENRGTDRHTDRTPCDKRQRQSDASTSQGKPRSNMALLTP